MKRTCPECENVVKFEEIPSDEQRDTLARVQFRCPNCKAICVPFYTDMLCMEGISPDWDNNLLQFARILSELKALSLGEELWDGLLEQTGLTSDQLSDIFERAQFVWDQSKQLEFDHAKARWTRERFIRVGSKDSFCWKVNDGEAVYESIQLPPMPKGIGNRISRILALALNTEPATMGAPPIPKKH